MLEVVLLMELTLPSTLPQIILIPTIQYMGSVKLSSYFSGEIKYAKIVLIQTVCIIGT